MQLKYDSKFLSLNSIEIIWYSIDKKFETSLSDKYLQYILLIYVKMTFYKKHLLLLESLLRKSACISL